MQRNEKRRGEKRKISDERVWKKMERQENSTKKTKGGRIKKIFKETERGEI